MECRATELEFSSLAKQEKFCKTEDECDLPFQRIDLIPQGALDLMKIGGETKTWLAVVKV